jgi:hypothetical protein
MFLRQDYEWHQMTVKIQTGPAVPSPVFTAIETQLTWVIKQSLPLLARTFSLPFAGNFAGKFNSSEIDPNAHTRLGRPDKVHA